MKTLNQCEHTIRTWDAVKLVFSDNSSITFQVWDLSLKTLF